MTRLPIIPTILVAGAVAVMVALGFWQLDRKGEKEALIAQATAALTKPPVAFPFDAQGREALLYRKTSVECGEGSYSSEARAGRSRSGQAGWKQIARCLPSGRDTGTMFDVAIGWSKEPKVIPWHGGTVSGYIVPGMGLTSDGPDAFGIMLQADEPVAGLQPLAPPDPANLPNNHLAYAGQWFFFALTALAIYWLALRRRRKQASPE